LDLLFAQYLKKSKLFEYSNQILEKKRATKFLLLNSKNDFFVS